VRTAFICLERMSVLLPGQAERLRPQIEALRTRLNGAIVNSGTVV
jgi:hypothetical protein